MPPPDEDLIITVDSLEDPIDTTQEEPKARQQGPIRIKVPGREKPAAATRAAASTEDDAVEDLRGQLTASQQRERDATRRANEATDTARNALGQVEEARTTIADTRVAALDARIASATTESGSLKSAIKAAMDAGNFQEATDLQEKLADARAQLLDAQKDKARIGQEEPITRTHEGAVRQTEQRQQRAVPTAEERRQNILAGCTPQTRSWFENHPDCIDDPERAAEAALVHQRALKAGHQPDTPAYFRFAEEQLGYTTVTKRQTQEDTGRNTNGARRSVVESAPVDRGGGGGGNDGGGGGGLRVELTRGEFENATNGTIVWNTGPNKGKPIGTKEMARRKAVMTQEGRYANPAVS